MSVVAPYTNRAFPPVQNLKEKNCTGANRGNGGALRIASAFSFTIVYVRPKGCSQIPPFDTLRFLLFKILKRRIAQEQTEELCAVSPAVSLP
jgi:hypothetical protein